MTRTEMIDYIAENLQLSHAEAEIVISSALRDSVRRQASNNLVKSSVSNQLSDAHGQQRRNLTMDSFKLKTANL